MAPHAYRKLGAVDLAQHRGAVHPSNGGGGGGGGGARTRRRASINAGRGLKPRPFAAALPAPLCCGSAVAVAVAVTVAITVAITVIVDTLHDSLGADRAGTRGCSNCRGDGIRRHGDGDGPTGFVEGGRNPDAERDGLGAHAGAVVLAAALDVRAVRGGDQGVGRLQDDQLLPCSPNLDPNGKSQVGTLCLGGGVR